MRQSNKYEPYLDEYQAGYIHRPKEASGFVRRAVETRDEGVEFSVPPRAATLDEARALITGDRNKSYGSPVQNFTNTADLWNVQFGHMFKEGERFTASHVAQAMILLKMARMIAGSKRDHWVDVAGYAGCGSECESDERTN